MNTKVKGQVNLRLATGDSLTYFSNDVPVEFGVPVAFTTRSALGMDVHSVAIARCEVSNSRTTRYSPRLGIGSVTYSLGLPSLRHAVRPVVRPCPQKQVTRIYARRVVACVKNALVAGISYINRPRHAMGKHSFPAHLVLAVSPLGLSGTPFPTSIRVNVHFVPKSFHALSVPQPSWLGA